MRSRGLHARHPKIDEREKAERAFPVIGLDYFWFGKDEKERESELPSLQVKDEHSGMIWSCVVPAKGADGFAVDFILGILDECGYKRVILKSDNEPSIKALKSKVKQVAQVEAILEEGKTGDKPSTGAVESSVKESKRQCRVMKSALQERLGLEIPDRHPILAWLSRHGSFLISRYRVGPDGRTPYERLKGRGWRRPMVTFGEQVWFRPLKSYTANRTDLTPQLDSGVYVGTHGRNGDVLIMTDKGVIKGGSVKRKPLEDRWSKEGFDKLRGTPWKLRPQSEEDIDAAIPIDLPPAAGRLLPEPAGKESGPRNLYVTKKDVEGNPTPGCPGCIALSIGLPARTHSSECRTLVQNRLMATEAGRERVLKAQKRKGEVASEAGEARMALEDVPDESEEMHGPDAVGHPRERVDPVGQPVPREIPERVDPVGRPPPEGESREHEDESPRKKAKAEEARGSKRSGSDIDDLQAKEPVRSGEVVEQQAPGGQEPSSGVKGPAPDGERATSILELASLVQTHLCENMPIDQCYEVSEVLHKLGISKNDVSEIYSPSRFVKEANRFGLRPGFAIDLEISKNSKGEHWDLSKKEDKREMFRMLHKEKPLFLIGSPPCGPFSPLQNISIHKRDPMVVKQMLEEGRDHLHTSIDAYNVQMDEDRFFLHEHPLPATSWEDPKMKKLMARPGVFCVKGPMCRWGMISEDNKGIGYVRKNTQFITNSKVMAETLEGECSGGHRHVHLINGRTRSAQVYPPKMVEGILRAIRQELVNMKELSAIGPQNVGPVPDGTGNAPTEELTPEDENEEYYDAITGTPLPKEEVLKARKEELSWVHKQQIYVSVPLEECYQVTGKKPITLKWLDRNKGDQQRPNFRSRLVVREIKRYNQVCQDFELYSAMPPLEALKVLCSLMTSKKKSRFNKPLKLRILDISRAHFYGLSRRPVYTNLPPGEEVEGRCARLTKTMYGTQDAASIWQQTYSQLLKDNNVEAGKAWPAIFSHEASDTIFMCHGDDFIVLGDEAGQKAIEDMLKQKFEYRVDGCIGPEPQDGTVMTVLNRILEYNKQTGLLTYEADPRHAEMIVKQLGLQDAKPVVTPSEKMTAQEALAVAEMGTLPAEQSKSYRSLVMRAAYLSLDRADIAETVKSLARDMANPTENSWSKLKRLGRYLRGKPRVVQEFHQQRMYDHVVCYCDSDHAGCLLTRKSTSGIIVMAGNHCLKASSNIQSTIALSSGESEFYSIVKAASTGMGVRAMYEEWKIPLRVKVKSDSSAARGICNRRGLGKLRHVQTRYLWVQTKVFEKEFDLESVGTADNVSDLCTKPVAQDLCLKHMTAIGQCFYEGRSIAAKAAN